MQCVEQNIYIPIVCVYVDISPLLSLVYFTVDYIVVVIVVLTHCLITIVHMLPNGRGCS